MHQERTPGDMISSRDKRRLNGHIECNAHNGFREDVFTTKSENRESLEKFLSRKVSSMEEGFKSVLLQYFDEVDRERGCLIEEVKVLHDDLSRLERGQAGKQRNDGERGKLIKRLTSNGKVLVQEIERLKQDVTRFKEKEQDLINENSKMSREIELKRKEINELEHEIKAIKDERSYYKLIAQDAEKLKESQNEIVDLENQIIFQQKMCKEYSLELAEKDDKISKLKRRCGELERDVDMQTNRRIAVYETEKKNVEKELESAKMFIEQVERKYEDAMKERERTQEMIESGRRKIQDMSEEMKILKMTGEKTERKYAKDNDEKRKLVQEIKDIKEENVILKRQVGALDKDLAINKMRMETLKYEEEILQKDLQSYETNLQELRSVEKEWKNEEQKIKEDLLVTRTKLNHYETENLNLGAKISKLEEENYCLQDKNVKLQTECDSKEVRDNDMQREILSYVKKCSKYEQDLVLAKDRLEKARDEYDNCNLERDRLQKEAVDLREKVTAFEIVIEAGKEEETRSQKQIVTAQKRYAKAERELSDACCEIESMKNERDEVYGKYHHMEESYDHCRHENMRLKDNLNESYRVNESLEEKYKKIQRDIKDLEIQHEQIERSLRNKTSDYEHAKNEYEYLEKDNNRLKQMLDKAEDELRDAQHELACFKRENTSDQQRQNLLRLENNELKIKTDELRGEIEKSNIELLNVQNECTKLQRQHLKLEATNKALSDQNEGLVREAEDVHSQMLDVRYRSNEIDEREAKWKGELEKAKNNVLLLEGKCTDLMQDKRELEGQLASLYREQAHYSKDKDDAEKTEQQLHMRLTDAENEVTNLKTQLRDSEEEVWNFKRQMRGQEELKIRADEEIGRWRRKYETLEADTATLQKNLQDLQNKNWQLEKSKRMAVEEKDASIREFVKLKELQEEMEKQMVNLQEKEEQHISEKQEMTKEIQTCSESLRKTDQLKVTVEEERKIKDYELLKSKDQYKKLADKCRENEEEIMKVKDLLIKEKNNTRRLETEIEDLNREKRHLEGEIERITVDNNELEALTSGKVKETGQLTKELMKAERKLRLIEEEAEKEQNERNRAVEEQKKLESELLVLQQKCMEGEEVNEELKQRFNEMKDNLAQREIEINEKTGKIYQMEKEFQSFQDAAHKAKQILEREMTKMHQEIENMRTKESTEGGKFDDVKTELHQMEMRLAVKEERCHILEIKLHEVSKARAVIEGRLSEAQNVIESQKGIMGELRKTMERLEAERESKLNEADDLKREHGELKEKKLKLEAEYGLLGEKLDELRKMGDGSEKKIAELEAELKKKGDELEAGKEELKHTTYNHEIADQELNDLRSRFGALEREYRSVGEEKDKLEKQIEIAEMEYEELHKELEEKEKENMKLKENANTIKLLKEDVDMLWENEKSLRSGEREQLQSEINELKRKNATQEADIERMSFDLYDYEEKAKEMNDEVEKYAKMVEEVNKEKEQERTKHNEELERMGEKMNLVEESGKQQLNEMREKIKAAEEAKNQYAANYSWKIEQNGKDKIKGYEQELTDLKNVLNDTKARGERSDAEIFRLKTQLDWVEEDRRESEQSKKGLQEDFNRCVGELEQMRGQLMENQVEREQLKQELARSQLSLTRSNEGIRQGELEKLSEALEETRRQAGEINRLKEENAHIKAELDSLTKERDRLESMMSKHDSLARQTSAEIEDGRRHKYEKDLLTSQLEAVARERRHLDRLLAEKEDARLRLENENEMLKKAAEKPKGKSTAHVTSASWHDEKSALKSELSEVYMKHQRDLERIEKLKAENLKLAREVEQMRRELQNKNQELDAMKMGKSERKLRREPSVAFVQQEQELDMVKLPKKSSKTVESIPDERKYVEVKGVDDLSLQSISKNPFLALDKERSKSFDDLDDGKRRKNPFAPPSKEKQQNDKEMDSKTPVQQPLHNPSGFSMLSDDLRASMDDLDKAGIREEDDDDAKRKERGAPSKDFVNKLRANFEDVKTSPTVKSQKEKRPKVDIYA